MAQASFRVCYVCCCWWLLSKPTSSHKEGVDFLRFRQQQRSPHHPSPIAILLAGSPVTPTHPPVMQAFCVFHPDGQPAAASVHCTAVCTCCGNTVSTNTCLLFWWVSCCVS
ncbi:unnamed protein product [Ectocarpus fasciculatus]